MVQGYKQLSFPVMFMLEKFLKYIEKNQLFSTSDRVLLAISGGIDSVVMSYLFFQAKFQFGIVHCHFSLRPEADEEADFVKALAEKFAVPFYFKKFETETFAKNEKISIQMAARQLRYDFFEQIRSENQYDYIATAHHLNDSLETAILNFAKGTGIAGLRGILPKNAFVVRPMLFATRQEIENFAQENQIAYREDSSNASEKYQRNFIRHQIVPRLAEQINPHLVENFAETAQKLLFAEKLQKNYFENLTKKIWHKKGVVYYLDLSEGCEAVVLHHFLEPLGFSFRQCLQMQENEQVGSDFFSENYWAVRDRRQFVITPTSFRQDITEKYYINAKQETLQTDFFSLEIKISETLPVRFASPHEALYFDAEKLHFPLVVRAWQEGDKFQPLGMKGTRMVSDFLIDEKVPKNLKKRIFVLESGKEITGILGMRSSEKFKIDASTQKVLMVAFRPSSF
jgi:tRNA(Ile)-lysidine synthase